MFVDFWKKKGSVSSKFHGDFSFFFRSSLREPWLPGPVRRPGGRHRPALLPDPGEPEAHGRVVPGARNWNSHAVISLLKKTSVDKTKMGSGRFLILDALFLSCQDDHMIPPSWERYRPSRRSLRIREVRTQDSGVFVCKGVNGFGTEQVQIHLVVRGEFNSADAPGWLSATSWGCMQRV